jgi:hypothetical protein
MGRLPEAYDAGVDRRFARDLGQRLDEKAMGGLTTVGSASAVIVNGLEIIGKQVGCRGPA